MQPPMRGPHRRSGGHVEDRPANRELDGRIALVTGAGGAIGSAIAARLAADRAYLVIADLDLAAAERVAATMPHARAIRLDATDRESCRAAVAEADGREGRLDILVNHAGLQVIAPIDDYPEERFDTLM